MTGLFFSAQIINDMAGPVIVVDHNYSIILANDAFCELYGGCRGQLIGKSITGLFTETGSPDAVAGEDKLERQFIDAQGRKHPVGVSRIYCHDERGNNSQLIVFHNITNANRMEKRLAQALALQKVLMESTSISVIYCKASGEVIAANAAAAKVFGGTVEMLQKANLREIEAVGESGILEAMNKALTSGWTIRQEFCLSNLVGRNVCINGQLTVFNHGSEQCLLLLGSDITEQKRTEMGLEQSEQRYRILFNHVKNAVLVNLQPDEAGRPGKFVEVSDVACRLFGYTRQELLQLTPFDLIAPETVSRLPPVSMMLKERGMAKWEGIDVTKDGHRIPVEVHAHVIEMGGKTMVLSEVRDLTEQKQAEEQLRNLSRAVEQSPVSIVITDPQGKIEYVNPKFVSVTGYAVAEVLGKNPRVLKSNLNQAELYQNLWATVSSGNEWRGEFCNKKKSGELFWELVLISPITAADGTITHFLAVKEDITARKKLEDDFRQAQKMEAFGRLAAGIAHDFNNMMTSVLCGAELLQQDGPLSSAQKEAVTEIIIAANRAAGLTRQLLMFSRRQIVQLKRLDLNDVVEGMGKMLRRLIGEDISLKTHYVAGDSSILADSGMLEQVLMNLVVNARDAMPNGGNLTIQTSSVEFVKPAGRQRSGRYLRLSVSDSGCGIAPENIERIFEPFFTTKEVGKGTGLGLATVFGIVEQHKGWTEVESQVSSGTTFHIYLPRQDPISTPPTALPSTVQLCGGKETILLVEDDEAVRGTARRLLSQFGYQILEADSGLAALQIWGKSKADIDLLFTDIVMPGQMSGVELGRRLSQDKPGLKVIYTSGYTDEMLKEDSILSQTSKFIEKPYASAVLLHKIRSALDRDKSVI